MKIKYQDLIEQTFDWPQYELNNSNDQLHFHGIPLMDLVKKYGSPLKFTYLPKIGENINKVHGWFNRAMKKYNYPGKYYYCYVTKSSHFKYILNEVLSFDTHLETSSAFDIDLVKAMHAEGKFEKDRIVICNGFKDTNYAQGIGSLIDEGFTNVIPVIDNEHEIAHLAKSLNSCVDVGIRIASEEEPKFEFYTSRLGIRYKDIPRFYQEHIENNPNYRMKMLHFFVNTGIKDSAYYWNELHKCLSVYCELKKLCPTLDSLNIGGGFPVKNSLAFDFDYEYIIDEIMLQIQTTCEEEGVEPPHIYSEFGSFTVGESGGAIYRVMTQKKQNDREKWNLIDSSFMTTLPDAWAINKRFIMLPLNRWDQTYERVFLGGMTCDSDDYYNSEQHVNAIYLPDFDKDEPLYLGFFNTGAYQESISGYGGIHHCLIPQPKHILIDRNDENELTYEMFRAEQKPEDMLKILGYNVKE